MSSIEHSNESVLIVIADPNSMAQCYVYYDCIILYLAVEPFSGGDFKCASGS